MIGRCTCLADTLPISFWLFPFLLLIRLHLGGAIFLNFMIKRWTYVVTHNIFGREENLSSAIPNSAVCASSGDSGDHCF